MVAERLSHLRHWQLCLQRTDKALQLKINPKELTIARRNLIVRYRSKYVHLNLSQRQAARQIEIIKSIVSKNKLQLQIPVI